MRKRTRDLLRQLEDIEITIYEIRGDIDYMVRHGGYDGIDAHMDRLEDFVAERVHLLDALRMSRRDAVQEIVAMRKRNRLRIVE